MTKQEQIEEIAKIVDEMYNVYTTTADDIAEGDIQRRLSKDLYKRPCKRHAKGVQRGVRESP